MQLFIFSLALGVYQTYCGCMQMSKNLLDELHTVQVFAPQACAEHCAVQSNHVSGAMLVSPSVPLINCHCTQTSLLSHALLSGSVETKNKCGTLCPDGSQYCGGAQTDVTFLALYTFWEHGHRNASDDATCHQLVQSEELEHDRSALYATLTLSAIAFLMTAALFGSLLYYKRGQKLESLDPIGKSRNSSLITHDLA